MCRMDLGCTDVLFGSGRLEEKGESDSLPGYWVLSTV